MSLIFNKNIVNNKSLYFVFYKVIDLFSEYNISKYMDENKKIILKNLYDYFSSDDNIVKNQNLINMKNIIVNYIKIKIINDDIILSNDYRLKDLTYIFNNFCETIVKSGKIKNKDELFEMFKLRLQSILKIQDDKYIMNESFIENENTIYFNDIKDKLYNYIYMNDIDKFIDIYICNNTCECTEQMLCNLKNEIINILFKTLIYKPSAIIYLDLPNVNIQFNIDEEYVINRISTFLTTNNFDIYNNNKTFSQLFIPPQ